MKIVSNADASGVPPQATEPLISSALADVRVLVVDDDADLRELLSAILGREGAFVTTADSARSGFVALVTSHAQLLVSDIDMPNEDGYSLIRRVRALDVSEGGAIPAIALTALQTAADRNDALVAGFDIHLGKPVFPQLLLHAAATLAAGKC
jgi:CheY-like chemotaxis protein